MRTPDVKNLTSADSPFTISVTNGNKLQLFCDVSSDDDITINLPAAAPTNKGKEIEIIVAPPPSATPPFGFVIVNANGAEKINGNMINGGSSITLVEPDILTLTSNGVGWYITGGMQHIRALCEQLSTGFVELDDAANIETYININAGDSTKIDITEGGKIRVVDWSGFDYRPTITYKKFSPVTGLLANSNDGNNLVVVDNTGTISIYQNLLDSPENSNNPNETFSMHNSVQIGLVTVVSGTINSANSTIEFIGNTPNRFRNLIVFFLGRINSAASPIRVSAVGGNLQLQIDAGKALSYRVGASSNGGLEDPDTVRRAAVSSANIFTITRDNVVQSFGLDVDVVNIESPVGTLTAINPNKHKNIFLKVFPGGGNIGLYLGQVEYGSNTAARAAAAAGTEKPEFSSIATGGVQTNFATVKRDETDISNGLFGDLFRIE